MITPNTDITLIAVYSVPHGLGNNSFGYSPITLRGSNDGTSIANFRLDISTWYDRENLTNKLVLYILSTETSIEIGNDLGVHGFKFAKSNRNSPCWRFSGQKILLNVRTSSHRAI